jgi:thiol-disulfide isomerase/thioredoxin
MARPKQRWIAPVAGLLLLQAFAVVAYFSVERGRSGTSTAFQFEHVNEPSVLPKASLVRADGTALRSEELLGQPVLLHFWATWCPPCREELPNLLRLNQQGRGLKVVAITVDEDWTVVRQFFGGTVPPEVVREVTGSVVKSYEVGQLPDSYLLDKNGRAVLRFGGARDWSSEGAQAALAPYLGGR